MYKPMTEKGMARVMGAAVFNPDALHTMTPGMFCQTFGVPSGEQWADLGGLLTFDARCRIHATGSAPIPGTRLAPSGYRPLALTHLEQR